MSSPSDSAAFDGRPRRHPRPRLPAVRRPAARRGRRWRGPSSCTGLRNTYGLGRSGRSKVLPMILLAMMLLPALILVGVLVQARDVLDLDQQLVAYSRYPVITQALISVFVAAQAPALISRDLRFRTITLYLARPMQRSVYVLVRLASLTVATFILIGAPLRADVRRRAARRPARGPGDPRLPGRHVRRALLLAALLSGLAARRGRADRPARPRGGRRDRGARRQLHRRVDDPGHRDRHRQRHGRRGRGAVLAVHPGQRRPGLPLRRPERHRHAAGRRRRWVSSTSLAALLIVAGSVGALLARYRTVQP